MQKHSILDAWRGSEYVYAQIAPGNVLCHHNKHLMGYFEFLHGSRIICLKWLRLDSNPVWPNGWVFVYELSGSGFESNLAQVFSYEFCEISQNTFFYRTPLVATSAWTYFSHFQSFACSKDSLIKYFNLLTTLACAFSPFWAERFYDTLCPSSLKKDGFWIIFKHLQITLTKIYTLQWSLAI